MSSASAPTPERPVAWRGRSLGSPLGHRMFIVLLKHAGLRAAYALLWPVAFWYLCTRPRYNRAVRAFLRRVDPALDRRWRTNVFSNYRQLGKALIDRVAVRGGRAASFNFTSEGSEHLRALVDGGAGGLLIGAHLGNWELAGQLLGGYGARVSVVMVDAEDSAIKQVVTAATDPSRVDPIIAGDALATPLAVRRALAQGRLVCLHGDRRMADGRAQRVRFLGEEAWFPLAPFALAASSGAQVCFAFVVREAAPAYRFHCSPPMVGATAGELIHAYVGELERFARAHPSQWFNYFDLWADAHDPSPGTRRRATAPAATGAHGDGA